MDFSMFENMRVEPDIHQRPQNTAVSQTAKRPGFPEHTPLAMAYVPLQQWGQTYDEEKAFERGTIFPVLDLPFQPEGGRL